VNLKAKAENTYFKPVDLYAILQRINLGGAPFIFMRNMLKTKMKLIWKELCWAIASVQEDDTLARTAPFR
jgi:hypothetical protein